MLRSVAAILTGAAVILAGGIMTMIIIAMFNQETIKAGAQLSTRWSLVEMFAAFAYLAASGFATAVIARRRELEHAVGLILFALLVSLCLRYLWGAKGDAMRQPTWSLIAGYASIPVPLLGAWLRKKQRILLEQRSAMMMAAMDKTRLVVGAIVACVAFLFILFWGTLLTTLGFCWTAKRFLGEEHPLVVLPISILFLVLASVAARRFFKRVIGVRKGLGELHKRGCIPEEET